MKKAQDDIKPLSWTVYILECADGTFYTGIARDPHERMAEHENGTGAKYMRGRGPFKLLHREEYLTRGEALRREAAIKALSRSAKAALVAQSPE